MIHTQHQQRAMARQFSGPFWLGSLLLPWRKAARAHTEPFFFNYYSAMGGEERTDLGCVGAVPFTSPPRCFMLVVKWSGAVCFPA